MKNYLTAQDVLSDIEFELIQGAFSKDDLGQGIKQLKLYQNELRSQIFEPGQQMPALREVVGRQFQLNDMLITMLQEMAAAMQEMQQQTRRRAIRLSSLPAAQMDGEAAAANDELGRETDDLEAAMAETLALELEARPTNIPVIGTWLHRLKYEMHTLVLFYLQKFGAKQTAVNQTYGDWLLYFNALRQHENELLRAQLAQMEARLRELEGKGEES